VEVLCKLCQTQLGASRNHPGACSKKSYLLTNGNPFLQVEIKVKICSNKSCKAMHQVWPYDLGKFSTSTQFLKQPDKCRVFNPEYNFEAFF
jgi:hypothetical protein